MAYFSNSSESEPFENECCDCPLGEQSCPIAMVQRTYNYKAITDKNENHFVASDILNDLVKQGENGEYIGCQMKPLIEKLTDGT